jgi:4-hydroxy-tetrahydrodipicolinate reductase
MTKINISIAGALGRMGKILIKKINDNKNLKLCSLTDINTGKFLQNVKIQSNSLRAFSNADVIIDFSKPEGSLQVIALAIKLRKNIVIGTTGFTESQNKIILKSSKKIAIFKSGNMSLGINILEYLSKIIAKKLPNNYQVSITDNHHKKKIDYPSGTALMLAGAIAKGKGKKLTSLIGKSSFNKKIKPNNKINFFITRKGSTIGKHSVEFNNNIERIELKHDAFSRDLFADGAISAAIWIRKKKRGFFNMQDMLNLN